MNEAFYTIVEFAIKLRVHPNTIRRCIKNGSINALKIGTGNRCVYRIPFSEVERMMLVDMKELLKKMANDAENPF